MPRVSISSPIFDILIWVPTRLVISKLTSRFILILSILISLRMVLYQYRAPCLLSSICASSPWLVTNFPSFLRYQTSRRLNTSISLDWISAHFLQRYSAYPLFNPLTSATCDKRFCLHHHSPIFPICKN